MNNYFVHGACLGAAIGHGIGAVLGLAFQAWLFFAFCAVMGAGWFGVSLLFKPENREDI